MSDEKAKTSEEPKEKDEYKELPTVGHTFLPLVTSIFKPTAEYLGGELKVYVKEKLEAFKEWRRQRNIETHTQRVRERLEASGQEVNIETDEQARLVADWMEGAQDVDADDGPLGEIWEELLLKIVLNTSSNKVMLEKLRNMTSTQAKVLIECGRVPWFFTSRLAEGDQHALVELEALGLVKRNRIAIGLLTVAIAILLHSLIVSTIRIFAPGRLNFGTYEFERPSYLYYFINFRENIIDSIKTFPEFPSFIVTAFLAYFSYARLSKYLTLWAPTSIGQALLVHAPLPSASLQRERLRER